MPTERAKKGAKKDAKAGKAPSTQAGNFVKEEMEKLKRGTGRAQSPKQAIAIGLSEARKEGVDVPPPRKRAAAKKKKSGSGRSAK